jgi:hypothetical protein
LTPAGGSTGGGMSAHPLWLSFYWSVAALLACAILGAPFVLLRRFIVRPTLPYLRWGYLGVAATPSAFFSLIFWSVKTRWEVLSSSKSRCWARR